MSLWDDVNKSVDDQMETEELQRYCEEREKGYSGNVHNTNVSREYGNVNGIGWRDARYYGKKKSGRKIIRYEINQYNANQNYSEKVYENRLIVITALIILVLSLIYTFFIAR